MNFFEKIEAREQVEKDMQDFRREAARLKREDRELKKAQSTGRVSSFLNSRAQSDEVLRAALGMIQVGVAPSQVQATVEYQEKVGDIKGGTSQDSSRGAPERAGELPPRPDDNEVYFLASENTELKWEVGSGGGGGPHPWKITLITLPDETVQAKVEINSRVHKGLGTWDNYTVVGLNAFTGVSEGYVVVWATIVDGDVDGDLNIDWGTTNERVEYGGEGNQTYAEHRIAYLYQDENDAWQVLQIAHSNLTLIDSCDNGKACRTFI
jgi:hypothetical protein